MEIKKNAFSTFSPLEVGTLLSLYPIPSLVKRASTQYALSRSSPSDPSSP
jgi:hypothetical protein